MTRVADVMTPGVETTTSSEALRDAARTMRKGDFGAMPVVDDGRLVGMLTDRDIVVRSVSEGLDPMSARVGDVASPSPVAVAPDQDLDEAMELMAEYRVRRLPVVDGERLVGVVSQADVALEANEKKTGSVVQEISEPSSVPRET
jgi:CBS domain-containing protein